MIDLKKLDAQLMLDEGIRLQAYRDPSGYLTVGVGRNLDTNPLSDAEIAIIGHDARTLPITREQALFLLHKDEMKAISDISDQFSWWATLDEVRARAIVDLVFNMGIAKFLTFNNFIKLMQESEYEDAGDDLSNTAWYDEVGDRGPRIANMISTGEDYTS